MAGPLYDLLPTGEASSDELLGLILDYVAGKALVNEKWMALCRELGPENVGLSTGDATVNRDASVPCCTAEVLANLALRQGEDAWVDDVVMDEFHWYAHG